MAFPLRRKGEGAEGGRGAGLVGKAIFWENGVEEAREAPFRGFTPLDLPNPSVSSVSGRPSESSSRASLERAFRETLYRVELGRESPTLELVVGEKNPYLDVLLSRYGVECWAWLTSVNPGGRQVSEEENQARLAVLEKQLQALRLPLFRGRALAADGSWPPEPSFLVLGLEEGRAEALAEKHGQLGFLVGRLGEPVRLRWTRWARQDAPAG